METKLIFGPPGTGKTTTLLNILREEIDSGTKPNKIAFVSFTRKAIKEATDRVEETFGLTKKNLPYFKTLHAMCYHELGLVSGDVMGRRNYQELGDLLGIDFSQYVNIEDGVPPEEAKGDYFLYVDQFARNTMQGTQEVFQNDFYHNDVEGRELQRYLKAERAYKKDVQKMDFTDMLEQLIKKKISVPVDVAIIDEAQDLTPLQWTVINFLFKNVKKLYVAGDDDQCIYSWAGARVNQFINYPGEKVILNQSYRTPRIIQSLANEIAGQIGTRVDKHWKAHNEEGSILHYNDPDDIDFSDGSWLILSRNTYFLKKMEALVKDEGYNYETRKGPGLDQEEVRAILAWEQLRKGKPLAREHVDLVYHYIKTGQGIKHGFKSRELPDEHFTINHLKEDHGLTTEAPWFEALSLLDQNQTQYYRSVLRRGESLKKPRIMISTIHGVKGGEADNVLLIPDWTRKTADNYDRDPDSEHRVFYVGVTRTKKNLYLLSPQTRNFYSF